MQTMCKLRGYEDLHLYRKEEGQQFGKGEACMFTISMEINIIIHLISDAPLLIV